MDDSDYYPVRGPGKTALEDADPTGQKAAQQARMLVKLSREEIEDKYLRLYEENILLKKHGRKQEDKIKKMATKLLRLVNDKKKIVGRKGRDIETDELIEDLNEKIRNLEKQNTALKEKVVMFKHSLQSGVTQNKASRPYNDVSSRINTGLARPPTSERIAKNVRVAGPMQNRMMPQSPSNPRYGHSLLEDTRAEVRQLEDVIDQQNEQINVYEQDIEVLKEQLRIREAEFEEDLLQIKQQMTADQRTSLQENVDLIRLHREVKEKSTKLTALQGQYNRLEGNMKSVKTSHDQVLSEMDVLIGQLKAEESKTLVLQNQLKSGAGHYTAITELEERVNDLRNENKILQDANEKLVSSAFDLEREREWRQRENALKVQIAQLEATLKADVGEKGNILDRLSGERQNAEKLEKELRDDRLKYYQLREEHEELKEKMKFFSKESAVDFGEIEEALVLIKQRKEKGAADDLSFLERVDEEKHKDLEKEIGKLQADHAETIEELEKTRNMLIVQHKINKDYQTEVQAVSFKMEEVRQEYEAKLTEYARLLDIRAVRIKKLEAQLKDVAYGTRQYHVTAPTTDGDLGSDVEEVDETIHLERGQNLFEIHISKVIVSPEGLKQLGDDDPSLFCTWEFFEFETQSTPVMKGPRPEFGFTSQYVVKVDDFFLHHLQKESTTLELHQALGTEYCTVAATQLKFRDIFEKSHGRVHGAAQLIGIADGAPGLTYGTVEFWVRLKVPMDQALRLYKERTKALGYLSSNQRTAEQALQALDDTASQRPDDSVNEVHINVIRCTGVQARRTGIQPSPYCVYKFFDYPDHDTPIVQSSNNAEFNDHKLYPVNMTADLDQYLKAQPLKIYVFDDTDPEEASYLGVATVPLLALAHDKSLKGNFELKTSNGDVNGAIQLFIKFQYSYIPPKAATKTVAQILATTPQLPPEKPYTMPGEDLSTSVLSSAPSAMPRPSAIPKHMTGPSAVSTPKPRSLSPHRSQSPSRASPQNVMTPLKEEPALIVSTPPSPARPVPIRRHGDGKKTVEFSTEVNVSDDQQPAKYRQPPQSHVQFIQDDSEDVRNSPISRSPVQQSPQTRSPVMRSPVSRSPASRSPVPQSPGSRSPRAQSPVTHGVKPSVSRDQSPMTRGPPPQRPQPETEAYDSAASASEVSESKELADSEMEDMISDDDSVVTPIPETPVLEENTDQTGAGEEVDDDTLGISSISELTHTDLSGAAQTPETSEISPPVDYQNDVITQQTIKVKKDTKDASHDSTMGNISLLERSSSEGLSSSSPPEISRRTSSTPEKNKGQDKNSQRKLKQESKKPLREETEENVEVEKGDKKFKNKSRKDLKNKKSAKKKGQESKENEKKTSSSELEKTGSENVKTERNDSTGKKKNSAGFLLKSFFGGKGKKEKEKVKAGDRNKKKSRKDEKEDVMKSEEEDEEDMVATEMRKAVANATIPINTKVLADTTFGDEESEDDEVTEDDEDDDDDDVSIPNTTQDTARNEESEDSEGLVVSSPRRRTQSALDSSGDTVIIIISHLSLEEDAGIIEDPSVERLFVEYRFLGYPAEELETPFSLPKPKPMSHIAFNFKKVFHVDIDEHYEHRQYLASMLLPDDPDDGRICFTIVSEPPEDSEDAECSDVGMAYVSLREILKTGNDLIDQDIDIVDVEDDTTVIGTLNVTVECVETIKAVQKEMKAAK